MYLDLLKGAARLRKLSVLLRGLDVVTSLSGGEAMLLFEGVEFPCAVSLIAARTVGFDKNKDMWRCEFVTENRVAVKAR